MSEDKASAARYERDQRQRQRLSRRFLQELNELMTNVRGMERLLAIGDDEWDQAVAESVEDAP